MKKIVKKNYKLIIGVVIGLMISSIGVYAVGSLSSSDVSYDNKTSNLDASNMQDAIDGLYKKAKELSGEGDTEYKDKVLNGADPVLGTGMIPVTIDAKGNVKYANEKTAWYSYEEKRWANAVILESGKTHQVGDTIPDDDIEAYFVWIPRYSYKIWNKGEYTNYVSSTNVKDIQTDSKEGKDTAFRRVTGNARLIDIKFGANESSSDETLGSYYTHPAFTLGEKKLNGIWVGKFEVAGSKDSVTVKPGITSWRNAKVGDFWNALYKYNRDLDSHMMKNTEWGAVAYLSHSAYGKGSEVNINNHSEYLTGYSATANIDQSITYGTTPDKTQPWNTATGHLASTTGNITGVYDISGGANEYVAAYKEDQDSSVSGVSDDDLSKTEYFDKYDKESNRYSYNKRKLGDATGEMGPFYYYYDKDGTRALHNAWYADNSAFVESDNPWFDRGAAVYSDVLAGQFAFGRDSGGAQSYISSRLVLAPTGN